MKLNHEQKEILVDNMFEYSDADWLEMSLRRLKSREIEIFPNVLADGWWSMYVDDDKITELNFKARPEILEKIYLQN